MLRWRVRRGRYWMVATAVVALGMVGCFRGLPPVAPPSDDTTLYYGRIELPDDMPLQGVDVFQMNKVYVGGPPFTRAWSQGYFLREGLPPGEYFPARFYAGGAINGFGWRAEQVRRLARKVEPGRCTYLGTFRITNIQDHWVRNGSFEVEVRGGRREEKKVLTWLINTMQGTGWDERLKQRLARL